jgi:chromosome partitioning protein
VRIADKVLVPLQPSMFDVLATRDFLRGLETHYRNGRRLADHVGLVGVRLDPRSRSAAELGRFVRGLDVPVAGYLRDTQHYVHLAAHGLSLFDLPAGRLTEDRATWGSLTAWLGLH